jgi:tRNA pseudouridine13 synthase
MNSGSTERLLLQKTQTERAGRSGESLDTPGDWQCLAVGAIAQQSLGKQSSCNLAGFGYTSPTAYTRMDPLPFLTDGQHSIGGQIRLEPDDFRVEEIPAYEASGEGEHLFVQFEKRSITTPDAVRAIANALQVDFRSCGWAGLKDRHAVTVQTASFPRGNAERAQSLELPNIRVLSARLHRNKLKSGHLHGNRFQIRVRDCVPEAWDIAQSVMEKLRTVGVPNYYGTQRFGREGDNAIRGRRWLLGEDPAPRDGFLRKMYVSALQSELFNQYVAERLNDGLLDRYVQGDLAVRHPSDKVFAIEPDEAEVTYREQHCSATGPMFGTAMRWPADQAREREERLLSASGITLEHFKRARDLGEGSRRAVRICLDRLDVRKEGSDLILAFSLPAGGYATAVLREFRKSDDEGLKTGSNLGEEDSGPSRSDRPAIPDQS